MARGKKIEEWLDRIDAAKKVYQPWMKDYQRWVNFFRGVQWSIEEANSVINPLVINYVFNTIRTMVPTLYFKNPKIYVHATRYEFAQNASIVQDLVNYDWRTLYIKREIKRAILRSLIGGLSWVETGYVYEVSEPRNVEEDEIDLDRLDRVISGEPEEKNKKQEYTEYRIKKDQPYVICRSILDVITDPFCNVLEESGWHAIKEIKPIEMVKRDPRFEGTKNIEANASFDDNIILNSFKEEYRKSTDLKFVELYHITDKWDGKTFTIARGHKNKLRSFDTPEGFGITPLYFNEDPENTQHISIVEQMQDQQQEKNRLRAYMLEHVERSLPRLAYDKNLMPNEADVEKLASSEHNDLVGVPGNPSQLIQPLNFPSLPADMFNVDSRLNEDMQIASGLTDFQRGQAVKVPSASEAQFIEQSSRLRVDDGLDVVGDLSAQISENIIKIRQQFTTGEQAIPIVGEDKSQSWVKYSKESIAGEYEFIPEYGSTQKRDQDFMKAQVTQVLPIIQNIIATNDPRMFELGRKALQVFEWTDAEINKIFPAPQQAPQNPFEQLLGQQFGQQGAPSAPQGGGIEQLIASLGGGQQ